MQEKKSGKKLLTLIIAAILLFCCSVGGTLAWLTHKTETIVNTFTAGDIKITLTEPSYNPDGKTTAYEKEWDSYHAIPGDVIAKDPTVTVKAGSEKCYVRIYMLSWWEEETDGYFKGDEGQSWFNFQTTDKGDGKGYWIGTMAKYDNAAGVRGNVIEFTYSIPIEYSDVDQVLTPLFTEIRVPGYMTGEKFASMNNIQHTFIAQAVQADGFDNDAEAFAKAGYPEIVSERLALHS